MDESIEAIQEQREKWIAAINEASAARFVAILTDDAVWLPSRRDALHGKERIRSWLEEPFAVLEYDYSVSEVRLRLAGDWAVEQARFSTRAWTEFGEEMPLHEGQYTILWRKTSTGEWLIERYIDHSAHSVEVD